MTEQERYGRAAKFVARARNRLVYVGRGAWGPDTERWIYRSLDRVRKLSSAAITEEQRSRAERVILYYLAQAQYNRGWQGVQDDGQEGTVEVGYTVDPEPSYLLPWDLAPWRPFDYVTMCKAIAEAEPGEETRNAVFNVQAWMHNDDQKRGATPYFDWL